MYLCVRGIHLDISTCIWLSCWVNSVALFDFHISFYMNQYLDKEHITLWEGLSRPWSYGSWIYNYLCNQFISPLMLWFRISIRAMCIILCDKVCQYLATGRVTPGPPVSSNNKTDRHDITEILLKVVLNSIKQTSKILWPLDEIFILTNTHHVNI